MYMEVKNVKKQLAILLFTLVIAVGLSGAASAADPISKDNKGKWFDGKDKFKKDSKFKKDFRFKHKSKFKHGRFKHKFKTVVIVIKKKWKTIIIIKKKWTTTYIIKTKWRTIVIVKKNKRHRYCHSYC